MKALMEMYMIAWGKHTKAKSFEIWDLADFSYILFIENSVYAAVMAGHADAVKSTNFFITSYFVFAERDFLLISNFRQLLLQKYFANFPSISVHVGQNIATFLMYQITGQLAK